MSEGDPIPRDNPGFTPVKPAPAPGTEPAPPVTGTSGWNLRAGTPDAGLLNPSGNLDRPPTPFELGLIEGQKPRFPPPGGLAPYPGPNPSDDPTGGGWWKTVEYNVGDPVVTRNKKKGTAPRLETIGGNNSLIPIIYGRQRVGARIGAVLRHGTKLVLLCVWCRGEVDAVESVLANNVAVPGLVEQTHYTGTNTQEPDPTLIAAALSNGIVYSDNLRGICYSVFKFSGRNFDGFPRFTAQIRGLKVRATQFGARAWSQNPALCLADFIESTEYGWGKVCDWATVSDAADYCDELVGTPTEVRRQLDIVLDQQSECSAWVQTLREYAGCYVMREGDAYRFVPDNDAASVFVLDESNIISGTETFSWRGARDVPTVVAVDYVDITGDQYRDNRIIKYASGVLEGATPRRVMSIQATGTTRFSEANRRAIELLNSATLIDMTMECVVDDSAVALNLCDIVTVTHPVGITSKKFRVVRIGHADHGRWRIGLVEHDPAVYSDLVESGPGVVDTDLPSPNDPPAVTGLAATEDFYMTKDGSLASRISLTWDSTDYPFVSYYMVECFEGTVSGAVVFVADSSTNAFVTPPLREGQQYEMRVTMVSSSGARGDADLETITILGKLALPGDVGTFSVFSSNGETHAAWERPADLDITGYELRWSAQSGTWEAASHLAFVAAPALKFSTTLVVPGPIRLWIKSLDSVRTEAHPNGQECVNANYVDFTSTESSTSSTGEYAYSSVTLTNMIQIGTHYVTAPSGDTWNSIFSSDVLNTFTSALFTYHGSVTSGLVTDTIDLGSSEATSVLVTLEYTDLSGTGQVYIEHKVNSGDSWSRENASAATVTARYFRWGVDTTGSGTIDVSSVGVLRATRDQTQRFVKDTTLNDAVAWMM